MNTALGRAIDRRSTEEPTPEAEDLGLFKGEICQLQIELTPSMSHNGRSDISIDGFIHGGAYVIVVFAGRRRLLFGPLNSRLKASRASYEKKRVAELGTDADANFPITDVRLPVLIEGCWRMKFELDQEGFQQRVSQFVAARWVYATETGDLKTFGSTPLQYGMRA